MKLKLYNTVKNTPNIFSMKSATKTFKKILEKEMLENKLKHNKILSTKKDQFFQMINKAFFKQDIKEKDQDFIYREIKRMQKHHQNLIDLYGKNAQDRIIIESPEQIKYDKKLLFNPYKNENEKNKKYKYDIFFKEKKRMNLPFILRKKNNTKLVKNILKKDNYLNKSNFSQNNEKNSIMSRYNSLNTETSSKYTKCYSLYKNNRKNNSISNSSEGNQFNKNEYLNTLDSLYQESIYNQKRQRKYFNSFDYGCSFYINKCNYIKKNLYNN